MVPALGIIELSFIARGIAATDAAIKRAPIEVFASRPVSGGRHLVFMRGDVASVEESMQAACEAATDGLIDSLFLPNAHDQVWPLLPDPVTSAEWQDEAVVIVETSTVCGTVHAADAAAKAADVVLRDMRLAVAIAGRAFFTLSGRLDQAQAAAEAARDVAGERLLDLQIIAAPDQELIGRLVF